MATTFKGTFWNSPKHSQPLTAPEAQLRKDRITASVVLVIVLAMMALLFWVASLGTPVPNNMDYWPMY